MTPSDDAAPTTLVVSPGQPSHRVHLRPALTCLTGQARVIVRRRPSSLLQALHPFVCLHPAEHAERPA